MSLNIQLQTSLVRSKFIEALQNYQQVEMQNRTRYRQRVERQFKIGALRIFYVLSAILRFTLPVKPNATSEEVAAVVQGDQGAGGQVFAQAVRLTYFLLIAV
jgi:syntaxin 1B/2/3